VGHDVQIHAAIHEVGGAGGAVEAASLVAETLLAARQSALMARK
jgi:hypothetical protein